MAKEMPFRNERTKPRLWFYILFWLGLVLPGFTILPAQANFSSLKQASDWITTVLDANTAVIVVLGTLYIARLVHRKRLTESPVNAIAYGFGMMFLLLEMIVTMMHVGLYCVSFVAQCAVGEVVTDVLWALPKNIAIASLFAFIIYGVVWLFEQSSILQRTAWVLGRYGMYFAILLLCLWFFVVAISLGRPL